MVVVGQGTAPTTFVGWLQLLGQLEDFAVGSRTTT